MTTNANSAAMLPNGRIAPGNPVAITVTEDQLSSDAKKAAIAAIDRAYDIQWARGGIEDTSKKLGELKGRISECVYDVAKNAVGLSGNDLKVARAMFLALCAVAETHIRSIDTEKNHRELPMGQLIPTWTVYKSDMAKGLEKGIDPGTRAAEGNALKFPTGEAYRVAARLANGGATGSQAGNGRASNQGSTVNELMKRGMHAHCAAALQVVTDALLKLRPEDQAKYAKPLLAIAKDVETEFLSHAKKGEPTAMPVPTEMPSAKIPEDMKAAMDKEDESERKAARGKHPGRKAA